VNGVTVPLADQYALIPIEIAAIADARSAFNAAVKAVAEANSTRVAHADIDKGFSDFITAQAMVTNGITITPNINPPTGIYSEDGVHPNNRGYAFIANLFIDAINAQYGASVPSVNISKYGATGLPLP
jgi:lysophospholipase L1-like esterase